MRPSPSLALVLAAAVLGACEEGVQACPGETVAALRFDGTRILLGHPALDGLDPVPGAPDCGAALAYPADLPDFEATLAADPGSQAAALCTARGIVLFGQRGGTRYTVETGTSGAVLGACAPSCAAGMRLVVAGNLSAGAGGETTAFTGVLVEEMSALEGSDCGTCGPAPEDPERVLPCAARYAVTGTPLAP